MAEILADARASVNRTLKAMKLLIANKQAMDHEAVEDMHDDLVVALQTLSAAFKLDCEEQEGRSRSKKDEKEPEGRERAEDFGVRASRSQR